MLQLVVFGMVQFFPYIDAVNIFHVQPTTYKNAKVPLVPLQMQAEVETFGWISVFVLQAIFVLRGLPCLKPGQHYVNCLLLKIRFSFVVLCFFLTCTVCSFATLYNIKNTLALMVPFFLFLALKCKYWYNFATAASTISTYSPICLSCLFSHNALLYLQSAEVQGRWTRRC